jgi:hypothetical protein
MFDTDLGADACRHLIKAYAKDPQDVDWSDIQVALAYALDAFGLPANYPEHENLRKQIAEQRKWIEEHGGDLAGYVARYGRADDPKRHGGEAIYAADTDALKELLDRLKALHGDENAQVVG